MKKTDGRKSHDTGSLKSLYIVLNSGLSLSAEYEHIFEEFAL
jgi:hypothetical protein